MKGVMLFTNEIFARCSRLSRSQSSKRRRAMATSSPRCSSRSSSSLPDVWRLFKWLKSQSRNTSSTMAITTAASIQFSWVTLRSYWLARASS